MTGNPNQVPYICTSIQVLDTTTRSVLRETSVQGRDHERPTINNGEEAWAVMTRIGDYGTAKRIPYEWWASGGDD